MNAFKKTKDCRHRQQTVESVELSRSQVCIICRKVLHRWVEKAGKKQIKNMKG